MRIGSLTGFAFQKYERQKQRSIVQKHIPQYIQVMYYDLNYPNPDTLHIEGTLVGTSASNLATLMQQLKALHRSRKVVWIDASDAYQGRLDFCKIIKLQGPTIDANQGFLLAQFTIDAQILPPWGTLHTNPWRQSGIYFRDLNNVGREYALNPLAMECNYTIDNTNKLISWEFIVDNQNAFTNATSVQEASCDSATGFAGASVGAGTSSFGSVTVDNSNYKEGTGSIKATQSSPTASTWYGFQLDLGASGKNISAYDRLRAWFECDQTGQQEYLIGITDTSGSWRQWAFSLQGASIWMNVEFYINSYSNQNSAPNLSAIRYFYFAIQTASSPPSSLNVRVDDIRVELGYVNHCEDTNLWTGQQGTGISFSNDSTIMKEGLSSLKITGTSTAGGGLSAVYPLPVGTWDFSGYDFVLLWVRSDMGGNSTGSVDILVGDSGMNNYYEYDYNGLNANQWYRLVVPLRHPTSTNGTPPALSSIGGVKVWAFGAISASTNLFVDEIAVDVGNSIYLEAHLPDNIVQAEPGGYPITLYSWNGSSYELMNSEGPFGDGGTSTVFYYLDGTSENSIWNIYGSGLYGINLVGLSGQKCNAASASALPSTLAYTLTYGANNRLGINLRVPPATSDSLSGNYPSNDVSGFQAINKIRLKIQVYYSNEDTTYSGFPF